MKIFPLYSLLCVLGLTSACTSQMLLDPVVQKQPAVSIPPITPLTLSDVQWKVLNATDLKALLAANKNNDLVLIALDPDNYQNMNLNLIEIKRYITAQKSVIVLLKQIVDRETGVVSSEPVTAK